MKNGKSPSLWILKQSFFAVTLLLLNLSCEEIIDPYEIESEFKGSISTSIYNVIIRPDHSIWIIDHEYVNGKLIVNPFATRFNKFKRANIYEVKEGLNLLIAANGIIWYWGAWMLSSCAYYGSDAPIILTKLPGVISVLLEVNNIYFLTEKGNVYNVKLEYCKQPEFQIAQQIKELSGIKKITGTLALGKNGNVHPLNDTKIEAGGCITGLTDVADIESSMGKSYLLKKDGTVWGWGRNWNQDFGSANPEHVQLIPYQISGLTDIVSISSLSGYNLARKKDGTVWFWGYTGRDANDKQVYSSPAKIEGIENVSVMEAGFISFFIKNDGSVWYYEVLNKKLGKIIFPG